MTYTRILKLSILMLIMAVASSSYAEIVNRVYAIVGEKIITQYELETLNPKKLQMIYKRYKGEEQEDELQKYYLNALNSMIDNYVIEQSAWKQGVRVPDAELEAALEDIMKTNNVNKEQLTMMLEASNQTLEQYKWSIKIDIIKARLMSTVFRPKIIITDDQIKEYVKEHSEELELSDAYELRMMIVGDEEKLAEAMADYEKFDSFRETAMKFSEAGNADNGGYLGWIDYAFMTDEIQNAIKGVKKGATEPIKKGDIYVVYYVEDFREKDNVKGDKRDKIIKTLTAESAENLFNKWLDKSKREMLIQRKYEN